MEFFPRLHGSYLGIQTVSKTGDELTLNRWLSCQKRQIMAEFVMWSDDDTLALFIELRTSSSTKDLKHV